MSDRLLKESDVIEAFKGRESLIHDVYTATAIIRSVPSADRPQGEWIPCTKNGLPLTELGRREGQKWYGYRCSNCNHIYKGNALTDCNFCCKCGARMKGADDE